MLDKKIVYFCKVADKGSFSAAAKELYMSQANLSKQISALEEELGVNLFDRSGYKPVLTKEGVFLFEATKNMMDYSQKVLASLKEMTTQKLTIGFTGAFENRSLLKAINSFKEKHSGADISLRKMTFDETREALISGEIDLAFGLDSTFRRYAEISYDILFEYEICLICSFDHPFASRTEISVSELENIPMIVLSKKFGKDFYKDYMDACKKDGIKPLIRKEADTFDDLIFAVSLGEGVAIAAREVIRESEVRTVKIKDTHHFSKYVIAYTVDSHTELMEQLVQEAKDYFRTL